MRKTERTPPPRSSLPTGWHCAQSTCARRSSDKYCCHHGWRSCTCHTDQCNSASISQTTRRSEEAVESGRKGVATEPPRFTVRQDNTCCLHGSKGREGSAFLLPRLVGCRTHQRLLPWSSDPSASGGADYSPISTHSHMNSSATSTTWRACP